jgi:hypothetical protein
MRRIVNRLATAGNIIVDLVGSTCRRPDESRLSRSTWPGLEFIERHCGVDTATQQSSSGTFLHANKELIVMAKSERSVKSVLPSA